jgi:hypothetical protein
MPRYAQINLETGYVVSDSYLGETSAPNLIPIDNDFDLSYKKWDFETETWVEYVPEPVEPVTPQPTQLDRIETFMLKSQEQITQEARDAYTLELINSGII